MFDLDLDIKDKIFIITQSDLPDAEILSNNYENLAKSADTPDKQKNFIILQTRAQLRVKELTNK